MATVPTPAMPCAAPRVRVGVPKTVSEVVAELPNESATVTLREPEAIVVGIITYAKDPGGMLPNPSDTMLVVFAVLDWLNHVVAVPAKDIVSPEFAANPAPLIGTTAGALTAVTRPVFSVVLKVMLAFTVKVAVAEAVPAVTVIV